MSLSDYPDLSAAVDHWDLYGKEEARLGPEPASCERCEESTATDRIGGLDVCNGCYEHILDMGSW